MDLSIIIPLYNEAESLPELKAWIDRTLKDFSYEIIFVDDGSTDGSWSVIQEMAGQAGHDAPTGPVQAPSCPAPTGHPVRGIRFRRNYGKSAALYEGFAAAEGDIVVTMDADLQDSPEEIPEMVRMIREEGYDLVSGWKQKRQDNALTKNLPSKLYNWTARKVTPMKEAVFMPSFVIESFHQLHITSPLVMNRLTTTMNISRKSIGFMPLKMNFGGIFESATAAASIRMTGMKPQNDLNKNRVTIYSSVPANLTLGSSLCMTESAG